MAYEVWHEMTLTVGAAVGILTFLRAQEQRKDSDFQELGGQLSNPTSPLMRATAASQLPSYFTYRRYLIFHRPYSQTALDFVLSGLKVAEEEKFVRQALANALKTMLQKRNRPKLSQLDLTDGNLDELVLHWFPFDVMDLIDASLRKCDLGNARFVKANLWKADLSHSKLTSANLNDAKLWEAKFDHCNLEDAEIITPHVNGN